MITQDILIIFIMAPLVGVFIYLIMKLLSEFKW